jgi:hypothetical protein
MAGGLSELVDGGAAAGGKSVGVGLIVWTAYRLFVFLMNYFAGRHDARQARLDALDLRLAASLGKPPDPSRGSREAQSEPDPRAGGLRRDSCRGASAEGPREPEARTGREDASRCAPDRSGRSQPRRAPPARSERRREEGQVVSAMHQLQLWLRDTGRYHGDIDGDYGRLTRGAVLAAMEDGPDTQLTDQDYLRARGGCAFASVGYPRVRTSRSLRRRVLRREAENPVRAARLLPLDEGRFNDQHPHLSYGSGARDPIRRHRTGATVNC